MAPVEGGDSGELKPLGDDDQAGIRAAETEIGIRFDQVGHPPSISGRDRLNLQLTRGDGTEERCFRGCAELPTDEVGSFGDHERGCYERARVLNGLGAGLMVGIGVVGGREENARIDDEQALVSAEAVGQKLVGIAGGATGGGRAQPDEREGRSPRKEVSRQHAGQLRDDEVDADSAALRLGMQTRERVLGKIYCDGHEPSIGTDSWDGEAASELPLLKSKRPVCREAAACIARSTGTRTSV